MTPAQANIAIAKAIGFKGESVPDYWNDINVADSLRELVTTEESLKIRPWSIYIMTSQNGCRLAGVLAEGFLRAKGLWT